jgi:short-subunit dehydrogenase
VADTALITGASAGIGEQFAKQLSARGSDLILVARRKDRLEQLAEQLPTTAHVIECDLGSEAAKLPDKVAKLGVDVDVLVNNAGFGYFGRVSAMAVDVIRRLVEVDLLASIELTHALLPGMVERKHGAICFVTSIAGRTGVAGEAVYSATKAGLDAFAESLRGETAGSGVNISVVVPGVVDTGFFETRGSPYTRTRPRPMPADTVADAVVRAVQRDRAEEWRPRWLRIAPTVRALAPGAFRALAVRFGGTGAA